MDSVAIIGLIAAIIAIVTVLYKVLKLIYNRLRKNDPESEETVTVGHTNEISKKIDVVNANIRNLSLVISGDLSPKTAAVSSGESSAVQPPKEAKEKAKSLLEQLRELRQSGQELPTSVELDEAIAEIASGNYEDGKAKIKDYLSKMDEAWKQAEALKGEEQYLSFKSLGDAEYYQIHYNEALEWYKKALEIKPEDTDVLNSAGLCGLELPKYDDAKSYFEKALKIEEESGNKESADYATYLNNIGSALQAKGDYDGALKNYHKALEIKIKIFRGEQHPSVATSYNNIGSARQDKGDYDAALKNYHQALEIFKKVHGEEHPDVATDLNNIAHLYYTIGKPKEGLPYIIDAYKIFLKFLGPEHPSTNTSREILIACDGDPEAVERELKRQE